MTRWRPATRRAAGLAMLLAACVLSACGPRRVRSSGNQAAAVWPGVLSTVQRAADEGRYDDAERELETFAELYAPSPEATESFFWRALFQLDPRNTTAKPSDAVVSLDSLLLAPGAQPRRAEAVVLRRTALVLDSLRREATVARQPIIIRDTVHNLVRDREREAELVSLRDSLGRTMAELERIRKRLAEPRP